MSGKVPRAAFVEEYDEDARVIIPDTRQVANKTDLRYPLEPPLDVASDSGYSSRTAATVNSSHSAASTQKPPGPLKVDTSLKRADLERARSTRKDRAKERDRTARPAWDDSMQVGSYPGVSHHHAAPMARSPSRSRQRETAQVRHYPGDCWQCDQGLYHGTAAAEPKPIEYGYYMSQPSTPSVADYPPRSSHTQRYNGSVIQDINVSRSTRPHARGNRSTSYHGPDRPMSFHGMMPGMGGGGMMYYPSQLGRYEHGPPLSSSAYAHTPAYAPSPYGPQPQPQPQLPYYGPEYHPPQERPRERSMSRTRDQKRGRRSSVYGAPTVDYDFYPPPFDDDDAPEPPPARDSRQRMPSHSSHDRADDYHRMPPPPLKHQSRPQIIQKRPDLSRKAATSPSVAPAGHPSRGGGMDLSDLRDALPEYGYRQSSRETVIPERCGSHRDSRRSQSYHDSIRPSRRIVESSRRRQPTVYHSERGSEEEDYEGEDAIEEKQREVEEYLASRSAKSAPRVPLTSDALLKAKSSHAAHPTESDSGSQKSRSNSSRGSDARTQSVSGVGPRTDEDNPITMVMDGVTMSFPRGSVEGKQISVRSGETGGFEVNIGGKRPKKYLTGGSDYTGTVARREPDVRRPRGDRRSDRASRRSSQSTYSMRY